MNPASEEAVLFPQARVDGLRPSALLCELGATARPRRLKFPDGHLGWIITDYANARSVLADRRFSIGVTRQAVGEPAKSAAYDHALGPLRAGAITSLDPPAQTRLRRAVGERFTPGAVAAQCEDIKQIIDDQLGKMEAAGSPADLFTAFALPVPSRVICDLLGVPHSDEHQFVEPTELLLSPKATPEQVTAAFSGFSDYVRSIVEQKRAEPSDDVLSDLLAADALSFDEIAGLALELFVTGHETSAGLITMGVLVLLEEESRWELLRSEPALIDTAVEELLRYITVVDIGFTRTALEDLTVAEVQISAGESVAISLLGGNHDPAQFSAPDRIELGRDDNRHLAFGHGIHKCLGQHLARLELKLALTGLMHRFPELRLAVPPAEVPLESTDFGVYRAGALPVSW